MKLNKAREQLIQMYTDALKEDQLPWRKGWEDTYSIHHCNPISNTKYRGVNNVLLTMVSSVRGYKDPRWMTFHQIKEKGWSLEDAKGKGVPIEFWSVYDTVNKTTVTLSDYNAIITNAPDRIEDFKIMDRIYYVFNASHVNGIEEFVIEEQPKKLMNASPFIDNLIQNMGVKYNEQGNRAFYSPSDDTVVVPESHQFHSQYEYDATRLHELCHATGHSSRLHRAIENHFGDASYAKEELRAEISSSFIARDMNLNASQMELDNHKAYIQSWIQTLQKDPNELFKAIKDAESISEYVINTGELEKFRLQEAGEVVIEPEAVSLDDFLAQKGLEAPVSDFLTDKLRGNRQLKTQQGYEHFGKEATQARNEYHDQRNEAIKEYDQLVSEGKIRPKTAIERSLDVAHGHPDLEATQAARRMLEKRGFDWMSGKEIPTDISQPRYFIDMDGTLVHFNNTIPNLDVLHEQGYYRNLPAQEKVVDAVKELIKLHPNQVYVLSATLESPYAAKDKISWLQEQLPTLPQDHIVLTPYGQPKYDFVPKGLQGEDILLDDYTKNLVSWQTKGGKAIKLINNINSTGQTWKGPAVHYKSDIDTIINEIQYVSKTDAVDLGQFMNENSESVTTATMKIDIDFKNKDIYSLQNKIMELNDAFSQMLENPNTAPDIRVNLSVDDRPFLRNEAITLYDLAEHQSSIATKQPLSVFEILKDKAKNNMLFHQNSQHDVEKFSKLEQLFSQIIEMQVVEESITISM